MSLKRGRGRARRSRPPDPARFRIRPRRLLGHYRYVRLRWRLLFALIDSLGWLLFGPVRLFGYVRSAAALRGKTAGLESEPPARILVIQLDHLGDAVLSTGFIAALGDAFPAAKIEVLAAPWNAGVFRMCPAVHRVLVLERNRFQPGGSRGWITALFRCAWQLRRRRYDLAIDVRGEFPNALLMWLAGARRRVGWNCGGGGFLLTQSVAYHRGRHEVLSRLALLKALTEAAEEDVAPRLTPGSKAAAQVAERLRFAGLPSGRAMNTTSASPVNRDRIEQAPAAADGEMPLVVFHVGSGTHAKRWPTWHWRELLGQLIVSHRAAVVLVGQAADRAVARQVLAGGALANVVDWTGQLPLDELAALLARCDLFIGADSGPAHLAAAMGTRTIAIFSGTNHPHQWAPWGKTVRLIRRPPACSPCHRQQCPLADHPCMVDVQPDEVAALAAEHLKAAGFADLLETPADGQVAEWGEPSRHAAHGPDTNRQDVLQGDGSLPLARLPDRAEVSAAGSLAARWPQRSTVNPAGGAAHESGTEGASRAQPICRVDGPHRLRGMGLRKPLASDLPSEPKAGISQESKENPSV